MISLQLFIEDKMEKLPSLRSEHTAGCVDPIVLLRVNVATTV